MKTVYLVLAGDQYYPDKSGDFQEVCATYEDAKLAEASYAKFSDWTEIVEIDCESLAFRRK